MDKIQSTRVICEGGLDTTQNHLNLSVNKPGAATRLVNYEVGLTGGYRRLDGYSLYDSTYGEVGVGAAEGRVLGIIIFEDSLNSATKIIAARKLAAPSTSYNLYLYTAGVGWVALTTGYTRVATGVDKIRWAVGNDGVNNILCIVDGINEALLFDGTNWSEIDIAGTGANFANAGGNQAIDAPSIVAFFENHLFLGRDEVNNHEGLLVHSAPNAFYDFLSASGAGQIPTGIKVLNFKPWRENLFVFGASSIKKIYVDGADFVLKTVTTNLGLVSTDAVEEVGGDLVFLGPDGFRPIAGTSQIGDTQLEILSKPVQDVLTRRMFENDGLDCNMVVLRSKSQFRLFWSSDSLAAVDSKGFIGCLRTADQQEGWEFGELLGFRCSCIASKYVNSEELVLHGDHDGKVYRQDSGNDLNGTPMLSVYNTPFLDLGDTEVRKVIRQIKLFTQGEDELTITGTLTFDWGDTDVTNPAAYVFSVGSESDTYGDGSEYGDGSVYGGEIFPIAWKNVEGSFFSLRLSLSTYGSDASHSIHGIVYEYSVNGQR